MKSVIHLNTNLQLFDFLHLAGQNWILKKKKEQEVSNEIEILWIHMKSGINDVSMNDDETYQSRREIRRRERRRPSLQQRNPFLRSLSECLWWVCFYWLSNPASIGHEHVDVILLPYVAVNEMHIYFWSTTLPFWIHWANVVSFFPFPITYRSSLCNLINLIRIFLWQSFNEITHYQDSILCWIVF